MAAAGLEIRLPSEIAGLAMFAKCLGAFMGMSREAVQQHMPHFLFDAWPLGCDRRGAALEMLCTSVCWVGVVSAADLPSHGANFVQ